MDTWAMRSQLGINPSSRNEDIAGVIVQFADEEVDGGVTILLAETCNLPTQESVPLRRVALLRVGKDPDTGAPIFVDVTRWNGKHMALVTGDLCEIQSHGGDLPCLGDEIPPTDRARVLGVMKRLTERLGESFLSPPVTAIHGGRQESPARD